MDVGVIGLLVVDYLLYFDEVGLGNFVKIVEWLWENCWYDGGFF